MLARQPVVDLLHQTVPVAQQVEGDDRRDHQQRKEVREIEAGAQDPAEEVGHPAYRRTGRLAQRVAQPVGEGRIDPILHPDDQVGEVAAQGVEEARQPLGQVHDLVDDQRQQQEQHRDHQQGEDQRDDADRQGAAELVGLQPVADRVQEIGHRHAGDEGQQDAAEEVKHQEEDGDADQPEAQFPPDGHRSPSMSSARRPHL